VPSLDLRLEFLDLTMYLLARIGGIVLVGLDVVLDELRRHQPHGMTHRHELARPVVGAAARLDADDARRQIDEERGHLIV